MKAAVLGGLDAALRFGDGRERLPAGHRWREQVGPRQAYEELGLERILGCFPFSYRVFGSSLYFSYCHPEFDWVEKGERIEKGLIAGVQINPFV